MSKKHSDSIKDYLLSIYYTLKRSVLNQPYYIVWWGYKELKPDAWYCHSGNSTYRADSAEDAVAQHAKKYPHHTVNFTTTLE